jgi:uncharacterized C2H2 Zn-finger protein
MDKKRGREELSESSPNVEISIKKIGFNEDVESNNNFFRCTKCIMMTRNQHNLLKHIAAKHPEIQNPEKIVMNE